MMEALTVFDAIVVVLLIVSTLMALSRGFMRELVTMGAFIAAIAAGYYARRFFRDDLAGLLPEGTADWVPDVILFVGLFLIVYILIAWFGASLLKALVCWIDWPAQSLDLYAACSFWSSLFS